MRPEQVIIFYKYRQKSEKLKVMNSKEYHRYVLNASFDSFIAKIGSKKNKLLSCFASKLTKLQF